jgi:hypothetical protein
MGQAEGVQHGHGNWQKVGDGCGTTVQTDAGFFRRAGSMRHSTLRVEISVHSRVDAAVLIGCNKRLFIGLG